MIASPAPQDLVVVRFAMPGDIGLILNSWLKSYRDSAFAQLVPDSAVYYRHHQAVAKRILSRSIVAVACYAETREQVFGWVVAEAGPIPPVLHYVYVKSAFRRTGIARRLLESVGIDGSHKAVASHSTYALKRLSRVCPSFNPYLGLCPQESRP